MRVPSGLTLNPLIVAASKSAVKMNCAGNAGVGVGDGTGDGVGVGVGDPVGPFGDGVKFEVIVGCDPQPARTQRESSDKTARNFAAFMGPP